jgi:nucleotidyltransferase/DNA polymerase involved in DNA repair
MRTPHAIDHLDADCFYVSAERVRDRFLLGKPVGVLGNQGACVIAKSYEMKKAGVTTGMPIWEALRLCPLAVFVKRDFRWYEVLSRAMLAVVRTFSPRVEYYSIDEFAFEAVPLPGLSLLETAEALREAVRRQVGVPVTVGIGRTRTLAKLIADTAKPFGALALADPDAERALLDRLPVTEISGIAARRSARLEPYGITNCLDLALADRRLVRHLLTRVGEALWYELNGNPVMPLHTERPPHKMLSRGGSLGGAAADPERIYAWLVRNVERLVEELEFYLVWAGQLYVSVQHHDGTAGRARLAARATMSGPAVEESVAAPG